MSDQPAKKRVRNRAPKKPADEVAEVFSVLPKNLPEGYSLRIPPKPQHDFSLGDKTPAVIRWRLKYCPETMAAIYRKWDWQAWLDKNPE